MRMGLRVNDNHLNEWAVLYLVINYNRDGEREVQGYDGSSFTA